ncbi:hypothetical protein [Falsarthrobacter nasiphocae]|uniref:MFS family permease n=1 Tax=Falsarthrobacter nasiphocae TaxID=189863 RepID=A0AAE3YGG4_9MICC|nr:hypothetical protein [Falsarthrobacter nasiphocae]MDR6891566.1 MFS family permease [Falsarthrobacter nasiphocae]
MTDAGHREPARGGAASRSRGIPPAYWAALVLGATAAQFVSQANDFILVGALGASARDVGTANAIEMLPYLLLSIPLGSLLVRWRSSTVRSVASVADALLIAVLLAAASFGTLTVPLIWAVSALAGIVAVAQDNASSSLVGRLFAADDVPRVAARSSAVKQTCGIALPAAAGLVLHAAGAVPLLWVGVLCCLGAAAAALRLRASEPRPGTAAEPTGRPARSTRDLGLSFDLIGLVVAAGAGGGVLGAVAAERFIARWGHEGIRQWAPLVLAVGVGVAWLAPAGPGLAFWLMASHAFVYGAAMSVFNVSLFSWVSEYFEAAVLPKVFGALQTVGLGSVPLGALVGGFAGDALGGRATILIWLATVLALLPLAALLRCRTA